ncbi:MAG: sugar phosphate isomerase/epimerase, partial [Flavobacteriaceae bacterium]|nr:sugar phosphate isomerase/epimerase [Flavobacteriaceae bacterium]
TSLLLLCCLIFSCKNVSERESETAENETETSIEVVTAPTYKLSLAQWSLNRLIFNGKADPMDFADTAKNMGFEGLEYVSQLYTNDEINFDMKDAGLPAILKELKKRSDSLGMQNVLIMIDGQGDLSFTDEETTQTSIENHKTWIDAAQYLGCHSIRVNLFGEENPEIWVTNSVRSLKALAEYAAPKNVNIIVENHGGLSSNGALLARVMKEVGMDNCGTLPDFGNFCLKREGGARWGATCIEEYDMYQGIADLMPYAKGVSAKSYAFNEAGDETKIDYYRMMQIVRDSGFEGFVGIEFEGDVEDPTEGIAATKALVLKGIDQTK